MIFQHQHTSQSSFPLAFPRYLQRRRESRAYWGENRGMFVNALQKIAIVWSVQALVFMIFGSKIRIEKSCPELECFREKNGHSYIFNAAHQADHEKMQPIKFVIWPATSEEKCMPSMRCAFGLIFDCPTLNKFLRGDWVICEAQNCGECSHESKSLQFCKSKWNKMLQIACQFESKEGKIKCFSDLEFSADELCWWHPLILTPSSSRHMQQLTVH